MKNNYAIEEEILIKYGKGSIGKHEGVDVFNPRKAIRLKCLSCTCNQMGLIDKCEVKSCTLWPWRMGNKPKELRSTRKGRAKSPVAQSVH